MLEDHMKFDKVAKIREVTSKALVEELRVTLNILDNLVTDKIMKVFRKLYLGGFF